MRPPGSDMETMRRILKATCVAGLASLGLAQAAWAGEYHVYSCRTPSGEVAPVEGWSGSKTGTYDYAEDTCATGGALIAALGEQRTHPVNTDFAAWTFGTPTGATMVGATLWRAGDAEGGEITNASYEFTLAGPDETGVFEYCVYAFNCPGVVGDFEQPLSAANRLVVPNANLGSHLYIVADCGGDPTFECQAGHGDANHYAAVVKLYAADITLEQPAGPTASNVSGELASAPAVSGTSDVAFDASDPGAGVWEAVFSVDGQVAQSTVLNENGGRCKNVGQTSDGLPAFLYLQPCPPTVSVDVPFDTTGLSNGAHHLIVSVVDAAGNAAPVLDREIDVANPVPAVPATPGPPNGTNASTKATLTARWASTTKTHLTRGWGKQETITGRLTAPGGVPIGGALVEISETPKYTGAKTTAIANPRTGANGSFSVRLQGGMSSSTLRFAYRARIGDALPVATRTLTLSVRAGVSLSVDPRTTSVGRSIHFKGVLHGTPLPAGGKQLVLEARSPGDEWIEFDTISTGAKGRYHASYRFKFPGPARYQFRVVSKYEAAFPFLEGASNVVGVVER